MKTLNAFPIRYLFYRARLCVEIFNVDLQLHYVRVVIAKSNRVGREAEEN